jgi:hypothetical protein
LRQKDIASLALHQFKVEKSKGKIWSANALKISKTFVLIVS